MPSAVNNNQSGYSLVIVMIILGVMSTIAAGTTSMIRNQVLEQSTNRFHQESKNIMADVQNNFLNEAACTKTFENLVLNAATEAVASNIFDEESSVLYSKGDTLNDRGTKLTNIKVGNYVPTSGNDGKITVELEFANVAEVYGSGHYALDFQVSTTHDGSGVLQSCYAEPTGSGGLWTETGMDGYYSLSKVGIGGPASDEAALRVHGLIHGEFECRTVNGAPDAGLSVASCDADEYSISGGVKCLNPQTNPQSGGYIVENRPIATPLFSGWQGRCYKADASMTGVATAEAYAICCKK